jgi:hypothetical protein
MSLNGSYGLFVDLGVSPSPEKLEKLYHTLWSPGCLNGPESTLSEFGKIPRGAQGHLSLPSGQELACYTRFERDNLGYPADWQPPVLLSLGLVALEPPLPQHPEAQIALENILKRIQTILPVRLAVLGHSNLYQINAELIGPEWLDLQQELLLGLWLPKSHPLFNGLGIEAETAFAALRPQDWSGCLTNLPEHDKYQRYKAALNQRKAEPKIQLHWET